MLFNLSLRVGMAVACAASLIITAPAAIAGVPQAINYQAIARKPDGTPISSQTVKIRVSILRTATNGTVVYQETQSATTSPGGQFNFKIGTGAAVVGTFAGIDWPTFLHFLKVEIDPAGGSIFTDMGTQELVSVPYAQHAESSDTTRAVAGSTGRIPYFTSPDSLGNSPIYDIGGFIGINDATPSYTLDVAGTVRGQSAVRSDGNVIAGAGVTAGGDITAGGNGSVTGTLTVNGGKGVVYNAGNGTNLKIQPFTTATFVAILPGFGLSAEGSIGLPGNFTNPPKVLVGDIAVTGGTVGELYRVQLILYGCTANSCRARLLNTSPNPVNYSITWNCVAIGN